MNYWNKVRLVMMGLLKAQLQTDKVFPLEGLDFQVGEETAVLRCSSFEAILELPQEEWEEPDLEPDPLEQAVATLICMNVPDLDSSLPFIGHPACDAVLFELLNRRLVSATYYIASLSAILRLYLNPDDLGHLVKLYEKFLKEERQ